MNGLLKLSISGIIIGGFLVGCSNPETTETKEEVQSNTVAAEEEVPKQDTESMQSWESSENFGEWVSEAVAIFAEDSKDPRLEETNFDEGFNYYLKENEISELRDSMKAWAEGEAIEKDMVNLFMLKSLLGHEQFSRTSHLGHNGEAKEAVELAEQWDSTPDSMRQAHEYMKQLLNDLDVAFNQNGLGETYGVSHMLNGDKISEMERTWSGGE